MDLPDSDRGDFSCRRAVDSSSLAVRCTRFDTMNALHFIGTELRYIHITRYSQSLGVF